MPTPSQWSAVGTAPSQHLRGGKQRVRLAGESLPDGFEAIEDVTALSNLGTWPILQKDLLPAWWPLKTHAAMSKRGIVGDEEAKAWLHAWTGALAGDAACLREMGEISESGRYGAEVDLDRAFFWYHRAGLAGDLVARKRALELKRCTNIDPATMEDPQFIGAGNWRIVMGSPGHGSTTAIVELARSGTLCGAVEFLGGAAMDTTDDATLEGRWAYDKKHHVLSIEMLFPTAPAPGVQGFSAQVRILARQIAQLSEKRVFFGRDEAMAAYYFQSVRPG